MPGSLFEAAAGITELLAHIASVSKPKRCFDLIFSFAGIVFLFPFFLLIALVIVLSSGFPVFYFQKRVGKDGHDFTLIKFRTMKNDADKKGLLTIGGRDSRITAAGYFLRKYKLDELPQLFNVFAGSMSFVGPRPEVRKYVDLYDAEQKKVLLVKPGITDYASLEYFDESELLARSKDPQKTYVEEVMPAKLRLNLRYIREAGVVTDITIILKTIGRIFR
jgi:lipopolysaccharide/colanic/teichoic acid biosynthesis glycosyltransferase